MFSVLGKSNFYTRSSPFSWVCFVSYFPLCFKSSHFTQKRKMCSEFRINSAPTNSTRSSPDFFCESISCNFLRCDLIQAILLFKSSISLNIFPSPKAKDMSNCMTFPTLCGRNTEIVFPGLSPHFYLTIYLRHRAASLW